MLLDYFDKAKTALINDKKYLRPVNGLNLQVEEPNYCWEIG